MTSTLPIATVTAAIKTQLASAINGLRVKDTIEIPDHILARSCPMLYPEVREGFIADVEIVYTTSGGEGLRLGELHYKLRYTLAYASVGKGRGLKTVIPAMVDMTKKIIDGAISMDVLGGTAGVIDFYLDSVTGNGLVLDPAGTQFYGFNYLFQITEFIN